MNHTKRALAAVALAGAALVLPGASQATAASGGIIEGIGLLGGNGNSNEDSSTNHNVVAGGNQQLSGQDISNSPVLTVGGLTSDQQILG